MVVDVVCNRKGQVTKMNHLEQYKNWLESPALSETEKAELSEISNNEEEIKSRFFSRLAFGTAGLRGIMGTGLYRMNIHVIRHTTQALAELILQEPDGTDKCVAICYDSRISSPEFAREAACVIAGNGIHVRIFDALRPTPELSFAIREYGCIAGINVTASHNPKEYNGYKVYWADGAQVPPRHAEIIASKIEELDIFDSPKKMDFDEAVRTGLITMMGEETDELFLKNVMAQANEFDTVKNVADKFKFVYTPFHGAGYKLVPEALRRLGLKHIICVPEQMQIDGTFPTVESPNPENPEGFAKAIPLALENDAALIIGTDPDCDRVGIMVRDDTGTFIPLTGNQTGALLFDYLIGAIKRAGGMPANPVALKTIVSTEMVREIAEVNNVTCYDTFTGFKFMAEKKNALESQSDAKVVFAFEESYGYMLGDFVRDKDAVTASMLIAEMAAWYDSKGKTLYHALLDLYEKYGYYGEKTLNLQMPGLDGLEKMQQLMTDLRANPPSDIAGTSVSTERDYQSGVETNVQTGDTTDIELSGSNVLRYETVDGTVVLVRPSGTEPKVKVYILAHGKSRSESEEKVEKYAQWAQNLA